MKYLKSFIFLLIPLIIINTIGCQKNNLITDNTNKQDLKKLQPDLLPGTCPYDCHDLRCKAYYDGYCGSVDTPPSPPIPITVIINTNNPEDSAGLRHNEAIASILAESSSGTSIDIVVQLTINYLSNYGYDSTDLKSEYNSSVNEGTFGYTDVDSLSYKMYSLNKISSYAENYMIDLSLLINNIISNNDPSASIYSSFAISAINYENSIIVDNSLSESERTMLLSAFSVARYSAAYWGSYIQNNPTLQESFQNTNSGTNSLLLLKKFWRKVLGADAAGAITGAGAAIQSSKSIIKGGIFGAIIGSVATAVKEIVSPS